MNLKLLNQMELAKEQADSAACHQEEQLVFKIPVQFPAGMVRHIHRGLYKIEGCQRRHHGVSGARHVWLEQDRGVHRALGDCHFHDAFLGEQIIMEPVCLCACHPFQQHPHPHPAMGFM